MPHFKLSILLLTLATTVVHGQVSSKASPSGIAAKAQAQELWGNYKSQKLMSTRVDTLEKLHATRALTSTRENTQEILSIISMSKDSRERASLIRLLGQQHLETEDQTIKSSIEKALISVSSEKDKEVAKNAVLTYSRLGYFAETLSVLNKARKANTINEDEYYGDLVHLIHFAPQTDQKLMLQEIKQSKNDLVRDILAANLKNNEFLKSLDKGVATQMLEVLGNEPTFSQPVSRVGGFESLQYEGWLYSTMRLRSHLTGEPERFYLIQTLLSKPDEPRKLIAALWNTEGGEIIRKNLDGGSIATIRTSIGNFATSNPKDQWIQEITASALRNLSNTSR